MPTLKWILGDINITDDILNDARKNLLSIKLNLSKKFYNIIMRASYLFN